MKHYYLKITNPQKGTLDFAVNLCDEYYLVFKEQWDKIEDPNLTLWTKPVYAKGFQHVVKLYSGSECHVEFVKYLIRQYIDNVERLDELYELEYNKE